MAACEVYNTKIIASFPGLPRFSRALPPPCIILNTNRRTKNGVGLGTRLLKLHIILCSHTFFVCNALLPRARQSSWDLSAWWYRSPWILVNTSSACTNWHNSSLLFANCAPIFSIKFHKIQQFRFCWQISGYTEDHRSAPLQLLVGTNRYFDT